MSDDRIDPQIEDLLRREAPQVLAALTRRYDHFDLAENATQDALLAAAQQWPRDGVPDHPRGWLIRVGSRHLVDALRAEQSRRAREDRDARERAVEQPFAAPADTHDIGNYPHGASDALAEVDTLAPAHDDSLTLLLLCCHPALQPPAQIALTLRAVAGLSTDEIARAFLVPTPTMGQRISRAKAAITTAGATFASPAPAERDARIAAVQRVLYLLFNEGYTATSGDRLVRIDLATEAIRLARMLHAQLPGHGETTGLLALMLLAEARRPARTDPTGLPIPLDEQDRTLWNRHLITEGTALIDAAITGPRLGPYQIQAAVAALHDAPTRPADTDWTQILALHTLLLHYDDSPIIRLGRAVAIAKAHGPHAGLAELDTFTDDPRLARHHRLPAVRAHLLEQTGDLPAARDAYEHAARATLSTPEQRYLRLRATRLTS